MRTPPSLKWLIDKRARLWGEISKVEKDFPLSEQELSREIAKAEFRLVRLKHRLDHLRKQQIQIDNRPLYLKSLKADLAAIDRTLAQHDVKIDPELISPICSQWTSRFLVHGEMTRQIYSCLKAAHPGSQTTTDVVEFILSAAEIQLNANDLMDFRGRVSRRLGYLAWEKKISRLHKLKTGQEGRWALLSSNYPRG